MNILDRTIANNLKLIPKPIVRKVAGRYVAGETLADAVQEVRRLNSIGCMATIDLLGEQIREIGEADHAARTYMEVLDAIAEHGLDANVSVKPTHFGLGLDRPRFMENLRSVARQAAKHGNFVRIDMEDSPTTDETLRAYRDLRGEGVDNVGVVLQAMLRRTPYDVRQLEALQPSVRLCKGVYVEPPEVAWQVPAQISKSYLEILDYMLSSGSFRVGIATHDDPLIEGAERLVKDKAVARERYEFQMLLGVKPQVRQALVERGHRVRVYVPFGTSWYAYCLRRLRENPKIAGYVTSDLLKNPMALLQDDEEGR